jgi:hypothetical protein
MKVVKLFFCEALKKNRFYYEGNAYFEQNQEKLQSLQLPNIKKYQHSTMNLII